MVQRDIYRLCLSIVHVLDANKCASNSGSALSKNNTGLAYTYTDIVSLRTCFQLISNKSLKSSFQSSCLQVESLEPSAARAVVSGASSLSCKRTQTACEIS